ncbi:hypothetical protein CEW92_02255 [Bacillaceae bacterium SAS-127]|nr:hypothetical protein CEW92_02255 [Bacillaceae bacterium SAS-127]
MGTVYAQKKCLNQQYPTVYGDYRYKGYVIKNFPYTLNNTEFENVDIQNIPEGYLSVAIADTLKVHQLIKTMIEQNISELDFSKEY